MDKWTRQRLKTLFVSKRRRPPTNQLCTGTYKQLQYTVYVENHTSTHQTISAAYTTISAVDSCVLLKIRKCHLFLPNPIHACPCHDPGQRLKTAKTCRGAKRVSDALVRAGQLRETTLTEKHRSSRIAGGSAKG